MQLDQARPDRSPATTLQPAGSGPAPDSKPVRTPVFPEDRLTVRTWTDPVLDNLGHDPRSLYAERFWLAVLGPSCLFLMRRLAHRLEREPDGFDIDPVKWAGELGLGSKGGRNGPFWRALERACRFRVAQRNGELLVVRRRLAPLTSGQVKRLPPHLRDDHRDWAEAQRRRPQQRTLTAWSGRSSTAAPPPSPPVSPADAAPVAVGDQ